MSYERKTCSTCGGYHEPYCYVIELLPGSDAERKKPIKTNPDGWCVYWQKEPKNTFNGRKL